MRQFCSAAAGVAREASRWTVSKHARHTHVHTKPRGVVANTRASHRERRVAMRVCLHVPFSLLFKRHVCLVSRGRPPRILNGLQKARRPKGRKRNEETAERTGARGESQRSASVVTGLRACAGLSRACAAALPLSRVCAAAGGLL
jgi:hypothetical protein